MEPFLGYADSRLLLAALLWKGKTGTQLLVRLYLANINWDFFSFGKAREKVNVAKATVAQDEADFQQEFFQHEIRVSAAYLNLLAAQRLTRSQEKNLERAQALTNVVVARAKNGLNCEVNSSLAIAEVSNARDTFDKGKRQ